MKMSAPRSSIWSMPAMIGWVNGKPMTARPHESQRQLRHFYGDLLALSQMKRPKVPLLGTSTIGIRRSLRDDDDDLFSFARVETSMVACSSSSRTLRRPQRQCKHPHPERSRDAAGPRAGRLFTVRRVLDEGAQSRRPWVRAHASCSSRRASSQPSPTVECGLLDRVARLFSTKFTRTPTVTATLHRGRRAPSHRGRRSPHRVQPR